MTSSDAARLHHYLSFVDVDMPSSSRSRCCHRCPQVVFVPAVTALQVRLLPTLRSALSSLTINLPDAVTLGGTYDEGGAASVGLQRHMICGSGR